VLRLLALIEARRRSELDAELARMVDQVWLA